MIVVPGTVAVNDAQDQRWSMQKANEWYARLPWLAGANYIPSTAVNQLECWQEETFDLATINRELNYAHLIGMNVMRVFLHYLLWEQDAEGLKKRMDAYLTVSAKYSIKTIFVLFDDSWNPAGKSGMQPEAIPGVHNSGWLQCPGETLHNDPSRWDILERYATGIVKAFAADERVLFWDVYNEPGNSNYGVSSLPLLNAAVQWVRSSKPQQPVTVGLWNDSTELNGSFLLHSDIITFHSYNDVGVFEKEIALLKSLNRPVICTEYMARSNKSLFKTHLPLLKREHVGAISWGLVSGKTNTIFPYLSKQGTTEPAVWFHDIFHKNGTPFDPLETELISELTGVNK